MWLLKTCISFWVSRCHPSKRNRSGFKLCWKQCSNHGMYYMQVLRTTCKQQTSWSCSLLCTFGLLPIMPNIFINWLRRVPAHLPMYRFNWNSDQVLTHRECRTHQASQSHPQAWRWSASSASHSWLQVLHPQRHHRTAPSEFCVRKRLQAVQEKATGKNIVCKPVDTWLSNWT